MKEMVMELLVLIIQLIVVTIGGFVIGWLKEKIGDANYRRAYNVAQKSVQAAEQEFGYLLGEERRLEAIKMIRRKLGDKLSEEEINTLIQSAVFEMNLILKPRQTPVLEE